MRPQKPWFRTSRDAWFVEIDGKQVLLAKGKDNRKEAMREFHRRMASQPDNIPPSSIDVQHLCDLFLLHSEKNHEQKTFEWYKSFLQSFCDRCGAVLAMDVKPLHVTQWLNAHPAWGSSRRCAVTCVKRAFNWGEEQGIIPFNPIRKLPKPPPTRRERILTPEERAEVLAAIKDTQFREFVFALQETGCRPSEVSRISGDQVDLVHGTWELTKHKTSKKGKRRVVYLTAAMLELTRRLLEKFPSGPLFRGPRGGRPFSRNGIRCRFRRLREKLPHLAGVVAYSLRHTWITDALENAVPVATVAELAGHSDLKMIQEHYGHLSQKREHLKRAAEQARCEPSHPQKLPA